MTNHTNGPWKAYRLKGTRKVWVAKYVGDADFETNPDAFIDEAIESDKFNGGKIIADLFGSDALANAALIATAPDLLAKLEEVERLLTYIAGNPKAWETIHGRAIDLVPDVRELIAEAKGESKCKSA